MRRALPLLFTAAAAACGGSDSSSGGGGEDAGPVAPVEAGVDGGDGAGPPTPACTDRETCIDVDAATRKHTISPLLFGDNVEWLNDGDHLWDPAASSLRPTQLAILKTLGVTQLRYPGGTLSDFFHWQQAIGPVASRTPQLDPFSSTATNQVTQAPTFGPDELAELTSALGAQPLITANVGTGTADEAAAWLADLKSKGVPAKLWEIGNEIWLKDDSWAGQKQSRTPAQYAAIFDAYAKALRAVDPSVKVGAIGCHPSVPVSLCTDPNWDAIVLSTVTEKIDFFSVHDAYSPVGVGLDADEAKVFRAMLGASEGVRTNLDAVEGELDAFAKPESKGAAIAITEHAALFIPNPGDSASFVPTLQRMWSIAAAVYSATFYRLVMTDPRITIANHLPINGPWECPLGEALDGVSTPFRTAFFHVFRSFADAAGATFVPSGVAGSPTFDSVDYGLVAGVKGAPALQSVAVLDPASGRLRVWVINRDLAKDVPAHVVVRGRPAPGSVVAEIVGGPSAAAMNTAEAPTTIAPVTRPLAPSNGPTLTFPAHSLVRLTFE